MTLHIDSSYTHGLGGYGPCGVILSICGYLSPYTYEQRSVHRSPVISVFGQTSFLGGLTQDSMIISTLSCLHALFSVYPISYVVYL